MTSYNHLRRCYDCGSEWYVRYSGSRKGGSASLYRPKWRLRCKECQIRFKKELRYSPRKRACKVWKRFTKEDKERYKETVRRLEHADYIASP